MDLLEIVDENDEVIGVAPRSECHGDPSLVHRTAHVAVVNSNGGLLLQKRSSSKDLYPGYWDTAVGGHLDVGESYEQAARREMSEELGISSTLELTLLFKHPIRSDVESENTAVYLLKFDGPFSPDPDEIDEVKFWTSRELDSVLTAPGTAVFTPNLVGEIARLRTIGVIK